MITFCSLSLLKGMLISTNDAGRHGCWSGWGGGQKQLAEAVGYIAAVPSSHCSMASNTTLVCGFFL